eukprot:CAMPEP_0182858950 /NCGR_PEP_ID=MMETSP0034_2-20130328/3982_1 /TAXON_ID=156128 /ORGANISM="Nephroselmis pyriformis, Strain CCMP717" /LENGTH=180 /DNA_ID=CAMNT_0024990459 /DNA_START=322 /DNA_END=864 /DNA_ORIENTATION=+
MTAVAASSVFTARAQVSLSAGRLGGSPPSLRSTSALAVGRTQAVSFPLRSVPPISAEASTTQKLTLEPLPSYKGAVLPGLSDIKLQLECALASPDATKKSVIVGAVPEFSDVVLNIPTVSGKHAQLMYLDGSLICRDLFSTNGTRVNGEKLPKGGMAVLQAGDIVSFAKDCPFQVTLMEE